MAIRRRDRRGFGRVTRARVYLVGGGRCALCGRDLRLDEMTIDHKLPRSWGGSHEFENLQPAHECCNREKGDRLRCQFFPRRREDDMPYQILAEQLPQPGGRRLDTWAVWQDGTWIGAVALDRPPDPATDLDRLALQLDRLVRAGGDLDLAIKSLEQLRYERGGPHT